MVVFQMRVIALQVSDRLSVELHDQRLGRDAVDRLADLGNRRVRALVPPLRHMLFGEPRREHRQIAFGHRPETIDSAAHRPLPACQAAFSGSTTTLWLVLT